MEYQSITRNDKATHFYLKKIQELANYMKTISCVTTDVYARILSIMPSDLAAKLRFVPDASLSGRLSHLLAIEATLTNMTPVGDIYDYSLVSIEGSNKAIPVDCDVVLFDERENVLVFVDFTSSRNHKIINHKENVILQNIELNMYKNAKGVVHRFIPVHFKIDIKARFSSSEVGTSGLKMIDALCTMDSAYRDVFINNCKSIFRATTTELARLDNDHPPGDYKSFEPSKGLLNESFNLVSTQSDKSTLSFLRKCKEEDSSYFPYYDGLRELLKNSFKIKPVFPIEASKINEARDLTSKLASLANDIWAQALNMACLTEGVVTVDEARKVRVVEEFPICDTNGFIAQPSSTLIAVKRIKGHVFKIKVSESVSDEKFKRVMKKGGEKKDKRYYTGVNTPNDNEVNSFIHDCISKYEDESSYFMSLSLDSPVDDIWKKVLTISALSSNDLDNFGRSTTSFLDAVVTTIRQTYAGASISHYYEVCKTVLASLKTSPGSDHYYVGSNGSYDSVTIVKMSSTLDSFKRCCFSVIYKPDRDPSTGRTKFKGVSTNSVFKTDFYSMDPNQLSYGLRIPFTWVSLSTWEVENNMESGAVANGVITQSLIDSAYSILNNRDQFAQAAEQVRYFYMSAIGYGGSAPDIVDKVTFMGARHHWEVLYLLRSFKLSACLCIISCAGQLKKLEDDETKELAVAFPHTNFPSKSFSQTISSMYLCNAYNKFRAFHEVSEAICYNEIIEEREIYLSRVREDPNAVAGLSPFFYKVTKNNMDLLINYITHPDMVEEEVKFALSIATIKSQRYSGSACYMIGVTCLVTHLSEGSLDGIYNSLNKAPIDACTMRGSMTEKVATAEHQGIRAASSVFEAYMRKIGADPESVNKSLLSSAVMIDSLKEEVTTFTIISCVKEQFHNGDVVYRYRIVQKDQKGHREISVLNFEFRVGALMVETISRELSNMLGDTEIANNPNKDKIIEDTIMDTFNDSSSKHGVYCYDNSDQKRWGPNHNMNFFAYAMFGMLRTDLGLMRLVNRVFDLTFDKRAKFPESLIDLMVKKNVTGSMSKPIDKFIQFALPKVNNLIFEERIYQGMCQGIYQETSSMIHAIKTRAQSAAIREVFPTVDIRSLTTSDDAEGVHFIPHGLDRILVVKTSHSLGLRVGNLINIVRSNPKSAFNFHIAELNSIFFKKGNMATPSLKQRISKVDIGAGLNHIEDYLSCLSSASNYLASGGSYMGTVILSILNLTLHTEQWLRWGFVKSENYYKPVELGGFPVIEPITTIISGGAANFYQRVSSFISADKYARLMTHSLLCPPEEISLSEFSRSGSDRVKKSYKARDLTVFKGTGPLGIFQMVRTDRKLSQFERRHGISKWLIPDEFATLKRDSPIASDFLFTIFRMTSVSTLETNLGVNSFFIRMAEPWASYDRLCMRMSEFSPFKKILCPNQELLSHKSFLDKVMSLSVTESISALEQAAQGLEFKAEFEVMEAQLTVRFRDAKSLKEYLAEQEAETFRKTTTKPSIQRVTLRGHTAADSDTYKLAVLKTLAGKRSKGLINEYKKSATAYSSFDVQEPVEPMDLVQAVIMADNTISLYEKFIRRDTKMILPNRVDDLKSLCVDVIRNKFSERVGMVLIGKVKLDDERSKSYSYSKWYRDLIKVSEGYETSVANSILKGEAPRRNVVGVLSNRAIITRLDNFEVTAPTMPEKTVLIDAKSRDALVSQVRLWLPTKTKVILSRETINSFIAGRLTFAHDYYMGHNSFYRYAKNKYFKIDVAGASGLHTIMVTTKINPVTHRRKLTYRHIIYFNTDVSGRMLQLTRTDPNSPEAWQKNMMAQFDRKPIAAMGKWIKLEEIASRNVLNPRKSDDESDMVIFRKLTPGMSFNLEPNNDSLCIMLSNDDFEIPITYLNPNRIDNYRIGYVLKHDDLVTAAKCYATLKRITDDFSPARYRYYPELNAALDFILVNSTTDTPDFIINKVLFQFLQRNINTVQLDILRTFMITNPKFGIAYSSSRFNQYLLNLGHRRSHHHSYLCKTALGDRADVDSEDWDNESAREEILNLGASDPHEFDDIESVEGSPVPHGAHDRPDSSSGDIDGHEYDKGSSIVDWSEDVIQGLEEDQGDTELLVQTVPDVDLFSDSESEGDREEAKPGALEKRLGTPLSNVQLSSDSNDNSPVLPNNSVFDFTKDLFSGINIDDVLDIEEEDELASVAGEPVNNENIDAIFSRALAGTYERIKEDKDKGLKSEKSGHTVAANLESSKAILTHIKEWIEIVGNRMQMDQRGILSKNISSVTGLYSLMDSIGMLGETNLLEKFFGLESMQLPADLSALAVVDVIYL